MRVAHARALCEPVDTGMVGRMRSLATCANVLRARGYQDGAPDERVTHARRGFAKPVQMVEKKNSPPQMRVAHARRDLASQGDQQTHLK